MDEKERTEIRRLFYNWIFSQDESKEVWNKILEYNKTDALSTQGVLMEVIQGLISDFGRRVSSISELIAKLS